MERIRIAKNIKLEGKTRKELVNKILEGININIKLTSEMTPCKSCARVIDQLNTKIPNAVDLVGKGTLFHNINID